MEKRSTHTTNNNPNIFTKLIQNEFYGHEIPRLCISREELIVLPLVKINDKLVDEFMKYRLIFNKELLLIDTIEESEFSKIANIVDLYKQLKSTVKKKYNMGVTTNASLKIYEILGNMNLVTGSSLLAFCNAEMPGAFIIAINHYMRTLYPNVKFDWLASSYYSEAAMLNNNITILDDRYKILENNREKWLIGPKPNGLPDNVPYVSGDLTDVKTVSILADAVHIKFADGVSGANLYTSDAGIELKDYTKQEEETSLLNYGQILCGILSLAIGGHLVTKQFTIFTQFSRSLIALLSFLFDELHIVKPVTSRPINSEIYLIGKGFRGIDKNLSDALLNRLAEYKNITGNPCEWSTIIDPILYTEIDSVLLRITKQLCNQQILFIKESLKFKRIYNNKYNLLTKNLKSYEIRAQRKWIEINTIQTIGDKQRITNKLQTIDVKNKTSRIVFKKFDRGIPSDIESVKIIYNDIVLIETSGKLDTKYDIVDTQIYIEHVLRDDLFPAKHKYIIVNQEFLYDWDVKAIIFNKIIALCKTRYALHILSKLNIDGKYISFTSPDIYTEGKKDKRLVLHIAGNSWLKGTIDVLKGWFEHGGIELNATLFIVKRPSVASSDTDINYWNSLSPEKNIEYLGISNLERKNNVYFAKHKIPYQDIVRLSNISLIHVNPSITEGWGHVINATRSAGSISITSDAPPMNELIDNTCGFLVPLDKKQLRTMQYYNPGQSTYYLPVIANMPVGPVDKILLMDAIVTALSMPSKNLIRMGAIGRNKYEEDRDIFIKNMTILKSN